MSNYEKYDDDPKASSTPYISGMGYLGIHILLLRGL